MEGRWTMVLGSGGELLAAHEGAATEDYNGLTPIGVVPCDDAAIERVARALMRLQGHPTGPLVSDLNAAEILLRAAGETP